MLMLISKVADFLKIELFSLNRKVEICMILEGNALLDYQKYMLLNILRFQA